MMNDKKTEAMNPAVLLKKISLAAHDLNNALSVAGGYPDILIHNEFSPEKSAFFLEQMKIAVNKAKYTTDLLLALGRCSTPDLKIRELNSLLESCRESVVDDLKAAKKQFHIHFELNQEKLHTKLSEPVFRQLINIFIDKFISSETASKLVLTVLKDQNNSHLVKLVFNAYQAHSPVSLHILDPEYFSSFVAEAIISSLNAVISTDEYQTEIIMQIAEKQI